MKRRSQSKQEARRDFSKKSKHHPLNNRPKPMRGGFSL